MWLLLLICICLLSKTFLSLCLRSVGRYSVIVHCSMYTYGGTCNMAMAKKSLVYCTYSLFRSGLAATLKMLFWTFIRLVEVLQRSAGISQLSGGSQTSENIIPLFLIYKLSITASVLRFQQLRLLYERNTMISLIMVIWMTRWCELVS